MGIVNNSVGSGSTVASWVQAQWNLRCGIAGLTARTVISVGRSDLSSISAKLGATHTVNTNIEDPKKKFCKLPEEGVDVSIEVSGARHYSKAAFNRRRSSAILK
ncbi:MAG: hypothetical protein ACLVKR_04110 [Lachnospiraceae bacterium]